MFHGIIGVNNSIKSTVYEIIGVNNSKKSTVYEIIGVKNLKKSTVYEIIGVKNSKIATVFQENRRYLMIRSTTFRRLNGGFLLDRILLKDHFKLAFACDRDSSGAA